MCKRVLITGGSGFVGGYLSDVLENSYDVHITGLENLDICSYESVCSIISRLEPDIIFHLAGQSSVSESWKNPQLTVDVNIKGAVNLLEAVRNYSPDTRTILIGSSEESSLSNIYAVSKYCQEIIGKIYHDSYGLDNIMTRSFNHIGAGQSYRFAVSDFCRQAVRIEKGLAEPVIKTGNISVMRDFTDVRDIVKAYAKLAEYGRSGEVYDVGSGKAVSLKAILDIITSLSSADIRIETDKTRFRPSDIRKTEADISKLQADTGWKPEIPLEYTINSILEYWRKNEND